MTFEEWWNTEAPGNDSEALCNDSEKETAFRAWKAATKVECEACAKVAEGFPHNRDWVPGSLYDNLRREVAAVIRKRSNAELNGGPENGGNKV